MPRIAKTSPASTALALLVLVAPSLAAPGVQDDKRSLAESKRAVAKRAFERSLQAVAAPRPVGEAIMRPSVEVDRLARWSRRWLDADLTLAADKGARVEALRAHATRLENAFKLATELAEAEGSGVGPADLDTLEYELLDARERLLDAQAE